jgi:hypothetical protein
MARHRSIRHFFGTLLNGEHIRDFASVFCRFSSLTLSLMTILMFLAQALD